MATEAPPCLLEVRALVREHTGLSANATGIVGDDGHDGGYHCGSSGVKADDYSVDESPRDRRGLTRYASALDVGYFRIKGAGGKYYDLRHMSKWMVGQCQAGAPDTRDLREIIYSPDGREVLRWDALGHRDTGDDSHLSHTHLSIFRDATKAGRGPLSLFQRYFAGIGVLDMAFTQDQVDQIRSAAARGLYDALWIAFNGKNFRDLTFEGPGSIGLAIRQNLGALASAPAVAAIAALGKPDADEAAIVAGILAVLTPQAIADAIPDGLAAEVVDELSRRIQNGDQPTT